MNSYKSKAVKVIISIVTFLVFVSTGFQDKFTGNWSYQEMPALPNVTIADMKFLDSLTGFAVMSNDTQPLDTAYILKTTNGGYNWLRSKTEKGNYTRIQFINNQTGYVCGQIQTNAVIYKTTNQGLTWTNLFIPQLIIVNDMYALNEDTIWFVDRFSLEGGVFRTTNGGTSWQLQWAGGASNPNRIYMFNKDFGFQTSATSPDSWLLRTTNSGVNWNTVPGGPFTNIVFFDSLNGYKCFGNFKKTTDGGLSWTTMSLPSVPSPGLSYIDAFSFVNRDTVWGVGGYVFLGNKFRGVLYNSTNGGNNWRYQIPDTSLNFALFKTIQFINKNIGWAYRYTSGIHTTLGGDTAFIVTSINNNEHSIIPDNYLLYQNYPNPFNPFTTIKFALKLTSNISLEVFDMKGRKIKTIIDNKKINSGTYEYGFDGSNYSSGVYFYRLKINNKSAQTNKMVLTK